MSGVQRQHSRPCKLVPILLGKAAPDRRLPMRCAGDSLCLQWVKGAVSAAVLGDPPAWGERASAALAYDEASRGLVDAANTGTPMEAGLFMARLVARAGRKLLAQAPCPHSRSFASPSTVAPAVQPMGLSCTAAGAVFRKACKVSGPGADRGVAPRRLA